MQKNRSILQTFIKYYSGFGLRGFALLTKKNLYGNKLINIKLKSIVNPLFLRNNTSDIDVFLDIFQKKEYDIETFIQPKVIVDCGANIGLASVFFKNKFPDATIFAIEPEINNYNLLLKNISGYKDVYPLNKGIWSKSCYIEIKDVGLGNWGFTSNEITFAKENAIQAISIDNIISEYNLEYVDILKIDIEGAEKDLFEKNTDNWLPKVKVMIIELHDRMRPNCSKTLFKALDNYDYTLELHGDSLIIHFK